MCTNASFLIAVNCGPLPNPPNGRVSLTNTTFMFSANYICDPTFILFGNPRRICQANAIWSGSEPTCQRESRSDISWKLKMK